MSLSKIIEYLLKKTNQEESDLQKKYDFLKDKSLDVFSLLNEKPSILYKEIQLFLLDKYFIDLKETYKNILDNID